MAGLAAAALAISVPAGALAAENADTEVCEEINETEAAEEDADADGKQAGTEAVQNAAETSETVQETAETEAHQEADEAEDTAENQETADAQESDAAQKEVVEIEDEMPPLAAPEEDGLKVSVYTDETQEKELKDTEIVLDGDVPEDAAAVAWPVVEDEAKDAVVAYQLLIYDKNGNEYHSEADDDVTIKVTIKNKKLTKAVKSEKVKGWKKNKKAVSDLKYKLLEDGSVQFEADEF